MLTLLGVRGGKLGLVGTGLLAVGCIGTAGYAMLLVFFRALVLAGSIESGGLDTLTQDVGLGAFLYTWIAAFYVGEALIAWALLLARTTPRWVPMMLLLHVASLPVSALLPEQLSQTTVLLVTIGLCGIGITASNQVAAGPLISRGRPCVPATRSWPARWRRARPCGSAPSRG